MVAAIPIALSLAAGYAGAKIVENNMPKPQTPQLPPPPAPVDPTQPANAAAANQQNAKGQQATIFAGKNTYGTGGVLTSGGAVSQRMLLGS